MAVAPRRDRIRDAAALGANTRNQQRHVADTCTYLCNLAGERGTNHHATLAAAIPFFRHERGYMQIEGCAVPVFQELQVSAARVRRTTQHNNASVFPF